VQLFYKKKHGSKVIGQCLTEGPGIPAAHKPKLSRSPIQVHQVLQGEPQLSTIGRTHP